MITRRTLLAATAVTPLVATTPALAQVGALPAASEGRSPATFVLVHGMWAGAWIWKKIASHLRAAGHDVYASTATGVGDRVHLTDPDIDLEMYATDVANLIEFEELTDIVLVGWSFGGMIITGVAERVPERIGRLVYLDADVPADGQSWSDLAGVPATDLPADYFPVVTDFVQALTKDPANLDWLLAKLVPQPVATLVQPVRLSNPAAAALPRTFVYCTEEKGPADVEWSKEMYARAESKPGWGYIEIAANHLAPINNPELTADALLALV
jgi:pimeloyl-ACP methyl ester carboxylesterase